jgi:hypothetical protein
MSAFTLCYMSMEPGGEATLADAGAILALVLLLSVKGHRLLPACAQTLYNMTCSQGYFKGLERISKALINIPASGFDHALYLMRTLANCSRFSWMRLRLIEDGAVATIQQIIASLPTRDATDDLVLSILLCLRALSENTGCRADLLTKNIIDMLLQLVPYADSPGKLLIIKTLHNMLQGTTLALAQFTDSVELTCQIIHDSSHIITLQYAAACVFFFLKHIAPYNIPESVLQLVDVLLKLLEKSDSLIQYFAINSAGTVFFEKLW